MGATHLKTILKESYEQLVEWREQVQLEIERKEESLKELHKALEEYDREIDLAKKVVTYMQTNEIDSESET